MLKKHHFIFVQFVFNCYLNTDSNSLRRLAVDIELVNKRFEDMRSLFLNKIQVPLEKMHIDNPVTILCSTGHWHNIASSASPGKMVGPERRPPPPKVHFRHRKALS